VVQRVETYADYRGDAVPADAAPAADETPRKRGSSGKRKKR